MFLDSQCGTPPVFRVLGVDVAAIQISGTIAQMESWIAERRRCHFIAVTGMHGLMEAQRDAAFNRALKAADLVVPDGMPLVWIARLRGHPLRRRVYGPELMMTFCEQTNRSTRHFLYGGTTGVAESVAQVLSNRFPGFQIAGTCAPPFRSLTTTEDDEIIERINNSGADALWVALGTPRQERWMCVHRDRLRIPVVVGVGAAFDFVAGKKCQAPECMRERGLEWLFRLLQEPRRLWFRYLGYGPEFIIRIVREQLSLRRSQ